MDPSAAWSAPAIMEAPPDAAADDVEGEEEADDEDREIIQSIRTQQEKEIKEMQEQFREMRERHQNQNKRIASMIKERRAKEKAAGAAAPAWAAEPMHAPPAEPAYQPDGRAHACSAEFSQPPMGGGGYHSCSVPNGLYAAALPTPPQAYQPSASAGMMPYHPAAAPQHPSHAAPYE